MPLYCLYALTIDSAFELPELQSLKLDVPVDVDIKIRLGDGPPPLPGTTMRDGDIQVVRNGWVFVARNGRELIVYPHSGNQPESLPLLIVGRLMANIFRQRGWLPLHASGVVMRCGARQETAAVLFLGESGYGKSTTAAAFHVRGFEVITDDIAAVSPLGGACLVRPSWPRIRLTDDSMPVLAGHDLTSFWHVDKRSVELGRGKLRRLFRIARIYVLRYGPQLESVPLSSMDAVRVLDRYSFPRKRQTGRDSIKAALRLCSSVASTTQVHELYRRRSLESIGEVVEFVRKDLETNG